MIGLPDIVTRTKAITTLTRKYKHLSGLLCLKFCSCPLFLSPYNKFHFLFFLLNKSVKGKKQCLWFHYSLN